MSFFRPSGCLNAHEVCRTVNNRWKLVKNTFQNYRWQNGFVPPFRKIQGSSPPHDLWPRCMKYGRILSQMEIYRKHSWAHSQNPTWSHPLSFVVSFPVHFWPFSRGLNLSKMICQIMFFLAELILETVAMLNCRAFQFSSQGVVRGTLMSRH